jgi:transposase
MKAIHGGKTKNDKIDSYKLALLLKGGNFPTAYSYPAKWRATRDLLRRRMYLSRRCGERVAHINNTNTQYNLPAFRKKLSRKYNHEGVIERFEDPAVRKSVEVDLDVIHALNQTLKKLEWYIEKTARQHDYHTLYLLRSIPGVGQILALVILYEVHDVRRFPRVQDFSSYARLIRPVKESAILMLRNCPEAKYFVSKLTHKYNRGKTLGIFTHMLGRAIYFMLKNKEAFDMKRFFDQ